MRKIHKYQLKNADEVVSFPFGSNILTVHQQHNEVYVWADVDSREPVRENRRFALRMTGESVPTDGTYLGTVHLNDGRHVIHVFEVSLDV